MVRLLELAIFFATVVTVVVGETYTLVDENERSFVLPVNVEAKAMKPHEFCNAVFGTEEYKTLSKNVPPTATEKGKKCTLYSDHGILITSFSQIPSNTNVYVVQEGFHFVWPTGIKQVVSNLKDTKQEVIIESLEDNTRIFRLHNFVTAEETDQLIANAKRMKLTPSTAGLHQKGATGDNQGELIAGRTSHNAWDQASALSTKLKKRSFDLLRMKFKVEASDGFQVVHYDPSQLYMPHHDFFELQQSTKKWSFDPKKGGSNRFATIFLYLSDVELGGDTVFPRIPGNFPPTDGLSDEYIKERKDTLFPGIYEKHQFLDQCRNRFRVKPKKGDAILFYHQNRRGDLDETTLHGACPPLQGEKWGANLWIWNRQTYMPYYIEIMNRMSKPVQLYQLNFYNEREFEITLQPGQSHQAESFVGRKFQALVEGKIVHVTLVKWEKHHYAITGRKKKKAAPKIKNTKHSEL